MVLRGAFLTAAFAVSTAVTAQADGHANALKSFMDMGLENETVTVFGPWTGRDKELVESVFAPLSEATGLTIEYTGSDNFEQQILIDVEGGSPPNVGVFPQPGLAADLAAKGKLVPLGADSAEWTKANYAAGQSWVDLGTYADADGNDQYYGFFYKVDVKSLVWFVPENFEEAGYEVPNSMEELIALSDQIVADGGTPWCIGLESGGATGWTATDWIEDIMLRTQAPGVYDQWVSNEIPFNDPRVVEAIEVFGSFARNEDYVGDVASVATTFFGDSPKGLFDVPAKCYMHRQASFIPSFFPNKGEELTSGDADFFYFPAFAEKDLGKPVLGAGTLWAIADDNKGARALMDYLKTPMAHEIWMAQTGFLTPHLGVDGSKYASDALRKQGEILAGATTFRFDASDLMPGAVGAGSFWTGMVDYMGGKSASDTAAAIQQSWDAIK